MLSETVEAGCRCPRDRHAREGAAGMPAERKRRTHIKLTSHPGGPAHVPIVWAAADPKVRGPVIASTAVTEHRNVIGTHAGSYAVYRALAVASGTLDPQR